MRRDAHVALRLARAGPAPSPNTQGSSPSGGQHVSPGTSVSSALETIASELDDNDDDDYAAFGFSERTTRLVDEYRYG